MKIWRGKVISSVLMSLIAAFAWPSLTLSASLNDLYNQRDQLQQEQEQLQSAAGNKAKKAKSLSKQISTLESDIGGTEAKIADTSTKITDTSAVISQISADIDKKVAELNVLKRKLNSAIVEVYRSASRSDWELLFSSNSLSDSVNQMKYIETIESQVKSVYSQVTDAKSALEKQRSEQEAKKAELDQLQTQQVAYKKSSEYQKTQKDKLLGMTKEQEQEYLAQAEEAQKKAAGVENQIRQILASRSRNADGTYGSGPGVGMRVKRGDYVGTQGSTGFSTGDHVHFEVDLDAPAKSWTSPWPYINNGTLTWPLDKFVITQDYGEKSNWYKIGYHMGIDIAGPIGSPVFAPADGKVVLNESFGGYGNAWAMLVDDGPYVLLGHLAD